MLHVISLMHGKCSVILFTFTLTANLEHALCVRDSELSKLEARCDELQQQLSDVQSQLSDKGQLLAAAHNTIQQNKVKGRLTHESINTVDYCYIHKLTMFQRWWLCMYCM